MNKFESKHVEEVGINIDQIGPKHVVGDLEIGVGPCHAGDRLYVGDILFDGGSQGQRCVPEKGTCAIELPDGTYTIKMRRFGVNAIERGVELPIKIGDDAAANGNGHPEDIDEDEQSVLHHIPKGDEEKVLEHEREGLF